MGAHEESSPTPRGAAGRHRRHGQALIERRDHTEPTTRRRLSLPFPPPSALVGIAVLVLIAVGVIHLSGSGTAVPLQGEEIAGQQADGQPAEDQEAEAGSEVASADSGNGSAPTPASASPADGADGVASGQEEVVVHVSGAVKSPGVVRLPPGSRVEDALQAAGGTTEEADLAAINLARPVADGEQIHVPVPGEEAPPVPAAGGAGDGSGGGEGTGADAGEGADGGTIDLNTASAAQLEELPGVGPAIAQRILEHREKNGPFTSVDGLLEVSGIGPATLEKIRERARV
ncbi:ComEA family DNA-binding protein [Brachybacterium tyrofermentans]|uniref:ComEA family DNA-binding protein n=1 Tax=Brachybacterium tyrofermentans TaxID=47848 RepID=UPI000A1B530A|nr:ComEA family DNA-binding protein [Brachybacterium tyrofermentans]SLN05039.1 comE operon protein 1, putative [Corynebacterium xerosis]